MGSARSAFSEGVPACLGYAFERAECRRMDSFDEVSEARSLEHDEDDEELEVTDIASDEEQDGDVDADGASAIPRRNE